MRVSMGLQGLYRRAHRRRCATKVEVGDAVSVVLLPADGPWVRDAARLQTPPVKTPLNLRTISATSALGRALVGHSLGDTVELTTAAGRREARIVAVGRST